MTSEQPSWIIRALAAEFKLREWVRDALCAQVDVGDVFFPAKGGSVQAAKKICSACDVQAHCREYAVGHPSILEGIWGGMSKEERREERKKRGLPNAIHVEDTGRFGCGTPAGYRAHYRRDEKPCEPCRKAEHVKRGRSA